MSDCIFCRIADGRIPSKKIWEDERAIAFHDINPQAPVHVLIVPKKHFVTFGDFGPGDGDIMLSMAAAAREAAAATGVLESGYRLLVNNGPDAHQEVMHVHMHLFGGRELGWMIRRPKTEG